MNRFIMLINTIKQTSFNSLVKKQTNKQKSHNLVREHFNRAIHLYQKDII